MKTKRASKRANVTHNVVDNTYTVRILGCVRSGSDTLIATRSAANLRAVQFVLRASRVDGPVLYVTHDPSVAMVDTSVQAAYC